LPKRDTNYMKEQRDKIAEATFNSLRKKGLHATNIREICRAIGISVGTFYTHFPSRNEAVVYALDYYWAPSEMSLTGEPITTPEALIDLILTALEESTMDEHRYNMLLVFEIISDLRNSPSGYPVFKQHFEKSQAMLCETLQNLAVQNDVQLSGEPQSLARNILYLVSGATQRGLYDSGESIDLIKQDLKGALEALLGCK